MLRVGGDVVGSGEESGLGAELDQLRLFQYAQCAALIGGVVGEGDLGPVREIGELLVLAGVEAEGDHGGRRDGHDVGLVLGVRLGQEDQVLEGVELDVAGAEGLVGERVVVEDDRLDGQALLLGLLGEDVPFRGVAGDADPDAVGVCASGAAAGHEQCEGDGGGRGEQGTSTRQCRNHCVIHVQRKTEPKGWTNRRSNSPLDLGKKGSLHESETNERIPGPTARPPRPTPGTPGRADGAMPSDGRTVRATRVTFGTGWPMADRRGDRATVRAGRMWADRPQLAVGRLRREHQSCIVSSPYCQPPSP